ncbi:MULTISPECIES: formyltetrahydrofolate deformylase [unclassified Methylophaga]|jgi:formyltetrahydrofolate deformylase|uniref:formyltetrahydrofolate deformylase n=1 Tax=unclassified Methylophaga TaxID=2629249 RepID=UPI000C997C72|nr:MULTISPECIES: formyltetrahydrofolate deformylase [unclassified Methylophaga]MAK67063.1 formyltetrahydrofolate deformylase [Methylophaga sp.]MAY18101.1 formyltetrahydrofolate deformylase [Methylophaga sp.]HCD04856.1 formyltetrahydrofolate deformylase [Methylophaga sp.]|tara:strand:+ start:9573 stop:10430 length:858 start_codon:yes stop_codon:yes gene_type:complete
MKAIVLLIQCADQKGLLAGITGFFAERGYNILHCQQYTDTDHGRYFMRIKVEDEGQIPRETLQKQFGLLAETMHLTWSVHYTDMPYRVALLVTRASHCPYDLLLRELEGELKCDIPVIIGNHPDLEQMARQFNKPFYHLPITKETKQQQESRIKALLAEYKIELVVMARYMQILSEPFVKEFAGKVINIHHGFLPAFQGAKPYHQAYERGVKLIGATAHYATAELDEGPIIEQDVERVRHDNSPEDLVMIGKDIERLVLARAVKAHIEHRIIVSGRRTIVFAEGA